MTVDRDELVTRLFGKAATYDDGNVDHMITAALFREAARALSATEAQAEPNALHDAQIEIAAAKQFGGGYFAPEITETVREFYRSGARTRLNSSTVAGEADTTVTDAMRGLFCPRPCNNRPDYFEVGACVDAGECGCLTAEVRAALVRP